MPCVLREVGGWKILARQVQSEIRGTLRVEQPGEYSKLSGFWVLHFWNLPIGSVEHYSAKGVSFLGVQILLTYFVSHNLIILLSL